MKYKLLVAEDAADQRHALCTLLNTHLGDHLTILEAGNGADALALFHQESLEIAILNIEMPVLSGLEVARKIREVSKVCAILFIADLDRLAYAKQAIALRALDYIPKPYDEQKLLLTVQEAIQNLTFLEEASLKIPRSRPSAASREETPEEIRLTLVREDISAYIDAHYMEELSMKNVAHAMNYSDAYFCKLFKQCFQVNFSTYLNEYRIAKAKAMIENPRINVKDASLACGYTDANYFSRVFKRLTGQTPTEYRMAVMEKALNI